jgi:acyl-CoA thioesterase I
MRRGATLRLVAMPGSLLALLSFACSSASEGSGAEPADGGIIGDAGAASGDAAAVADAGNGDAASSTDGADAGAATDAADAAGSTKPTPMTLISRGLPTFANHEAASAAGATDEHYNTFWQSGHTPAANDPDWIAIDLSSVPAARRSTVYALWFNEGSYPYDPDTVGGGPSYSLPGDYRYETSSAPGGGAPPTGGWSVLVTKTGNHFSSRADLLSLAGANWLRLVCTAGAATNQAFDTLLQWELYDAHAGADGWKFSGDSITGNSMRHEIADDSFNQLLEKAGVVTPFEMAAHGGWATANMLPVMDEYIANFPGRFFGIAFGTNEAYTPPATFAANMGQLIDKVLAAGKIPVVPTIAYTGADVYVDAIPPLNTEIAKLYATYGARLLRGPDLYKLLSDGRATMFDQASDLHPNAAGSAAIRQAWADMAKAVY